MANKILRQTAYKTWISDLLSGKYVKEQGEWEPNYVLVKDLKISRINLIANVIEKYASDDGNYVYIDLDDGSGVIRVKAWREDTKLLENTKIGDMVLVIGRPKELNSEMYILAEIVKVISNKEWAKVRKEELKKRYGEIIKTENTAMKEVIHEEAIHEEIIEDMTASGRQKVLSIIEKNEEISFDELIAKTELSNEEADKIIKELLKEGEIYQPRAGILMIV